MLHPLLQFVCLIPFCNSYASSPPAICMPYFFQPQLPYHRFHICCIFDTKKNIAIYIYIVYRLNALMAQMISNQLNDTELYTPCYIVCLITGNNLLWFDR